MTEATEQGNDGFSVLEALVAFTILSLFLMAASQVVSGMTRNMTTIKELRLAQQTAGEVTVQTIVPRTGSASPKTGKIGSAVWRLFANNIYDSGEQTPLVEVTITVGTESGRRFRTYRTFTAGGE